MIDECLDFLDIREGGLYIDATLGGGGHTAGIIARLDGKPGYVISFDADERAIEHCRIRFGIDGSESDDLEPVDDADTVTSSEKVWYKMFGETQLMLVHANFESFYSVILEHYEDLKIDGILFDLGVSSYQFDHHERGFSFRMEGELDMRFTPEGETAADILNSRSAEELMFLFRTNADEPAAKLLAQAIVKRRDLAHFKTVSDLKHLVVQHIPTQHQAKTMARLFQALRIAVNKELERLDHTIEDAFPMMNKDGRMVVMSYHSGEDRIVKDLFKEWSQNERPPEFKLLTKKPITPSEEELYNNPRSRSARLRAAVRIA